MSIKRRINEIETDINKNINENILLENGNERKIARIDINISTNTTNIIPNLQLNIKKSPIITSSPITSPFSNTPIVYPLSQGQELTEEDLNQSSSLHRSIARLRSIFAPKGSLDRVTNYGTTFSTVLTKETLADTSITSNTDFHTSLFRSSTSRHPLGPFSRFYTINPYSASTDGKGDEIDLSDIPTSLRKELQIPDTITSNQIPKSSTSTLENNSSSNTSGNKFKLGGIMFPFVDSSTKTLFSSGKLLEVEKKMKAYESRREDPMVSLIKNYCKTNGNLELKQHPVDIVSHIWHNAASGSKITIPADIAETNLISDDTGEKKNITLKLQTKGAIWHGMRSENLISPATNTLS